MTAETGLNTKKVRIHVRLLDEGTEVSRPTEALDLGNGRFKLLPIPRYDNAEESWEPLPGALVRSERKKDRCGEYLLAVRP